ncbi:MAG: hypothetical protein L0332_19390 [Chloroflexi bacterium]|nr:hypothetical protein [Chloroflexota bacterium]
MENRNHVLEVKVIDRKRGVSWVRTGSGGFVVKGEPALDEALPPSSILFAEDDPVQATGRFYEDYVIAEESAPAEAQATARPRRKKRPSLTGIVALLIIAFILWLVWNAMGGGGSTGQPSGSEIRVPAATQYRIKYAVTGTASRASLTYSNAQGGTEQITVELPWESDMGYFPAGDFVYISAQNDSESGSVICEIWQRPDNPSWSGSLRTDQVFEKAKTSTSQGAFAIASCDGSAGE